MIDVKCDLCGSDSFSTKHEIEIEENNMRFYRYVRNVPDKEKMVGKQTIVSCDNCGLVYTNPRFDTSELEVVYSSDRIIGGVWKNFWYLFNKNSPDIIQKSKTSKVNNTDFYKWKFDIIEKYLGASDKQIKLLDVGCGSGKFVADALSRGIDAMGIDLSPDRIRKGRETYGLGEDRLRCMNIDDFSSDEKFDVIVMWDIIEHVESPSKLLKSLINISHKETRIMALTMSLDSITYRIFKKNWNYINPTQHLHYFSHETIEKMYQKSGYELVGVEMDDSKSKNIIHLLLRIIVGQFNRAFFYIYYKKSPLRWLFKPLQGNITDERMKLRLENLYPGKYLGRYHDNFVFIGKLLDK